MKTILVTCGVLFFVLLNENLKAQYFKTEFEYLSASDGLAQNHVFNIGQDSDGFMWFCTMGGLSRYDGFSFLNFTYSEEDSTTISASHTDMFLEDSKGRCWVSTVNGFNRYYKETGKFKRYYHHPEKPQTLGHNSTRAIEEDKDGNIWIVHHKGVDCFNPEKEIFEHFYDDSFGVSRHSGDICIDQNENIWLLGTTGLFKVIKDNRKLHFYGFPEMTSDITLEGRYIYQDSYGTIWVAFNRGLAKFDPISEKFKLLPLPDQFFGIVSVLEYPKGFLALGSDKRGLLVLNLKTERIVNIFDNLPEDPEGIKGSVVYSLFKDRTDNLWIGLFFGVNRINPQHERFRLLQNAPGINNYKNVSLLVYTDPLGGYWFQTMQGLFYRPDLADNYKSMLVPPAFNDGYNNINAINGDTKGRVYFEARNNGLYMYDYKSGSIQKIDDGSKFKGSFISRLDTDRDNEDILWISTPKGLCKFNKITTDTTWIYPHVLETSLKANAVGRFAQSADQKIYFVHSGLLCEYNKVDNQTKTFTPDKNIKGAIYSVEEKNGMVWVATGSHIYSYKIQNNEWKTYHDSINNKPLAAVGLQIDNNGIIWATYGNEVIRINPQNDKIHIYTSPTGFINGSGTKDKDGQIIFGGGNGSLFIYPNSLIKDTIPPKIIFSGFEIANKRVVFDKLYEYISKINLDYEDKVFTLQYNTLHFLDRKKIRYRYRLEGFEDEWVEAGTRRSVTYTNLRPGNYIFHAEAINEDGLKSAVPLRLKIHIKAPFYLTIPFFGFVLFLLGSLAYIYYSIRKRAGELQKQKDLAEQNARYKSMFLSNMSHEIRTPMNAIMGLNNLMLDTELNSKQREYTEAIGTSCDNLLWIVNDILDQAKIESGKYTIESKNFDLRVLLNQLKTLFSARAVEKELDFQLHIPDNMPDVLIGDPVRIFQILTNLIGNAIKFTDAGKVELIISEISGTDEKIHYKFEIKDTGIGIPEDRIGDVFESFSQVNEQQKIGNQGTGLGLSIVKNLVEQLGGKIGVQSQHGIGSVFHFELPLLKGQKSVDDENAPESKKLPYGLRVLLVEDTPLNQLVASELLKKYIENVQISFAENGQVALEKIKNSDFDIVLMDVRMPVMDGIEATRILRNAHSEQYRNIPIIGLTANAIPQQIQECLDAGMNECVTKPIHAPELISKLSKILNP
ncbi:MAG: response regulator [Saprospiraceae bacterium]|nr:response regulator [Saprospiraceae bacterium]